MVLGGQLYSKRHSGTCFPVNFGKHFRRLLIQNSSSCLLLSIQLTLCKSQKNVCLTLEYRALKGYRQTLQKTSAHAQWCSGSSSTHRSFSVRSSSLFCSAVQNRCSKILQNSQKNICGGVSLTKAVVLKPIQISLMEPSCEVFRR